MSEPLPLKVDGKKLKAPRTKPAKQATRPVWTDYKVVTPVRCDHCVLAAYDSLQDGSGFAGMRMARRKRKQGIDILLLCAEHASTQKDQDDVDYVDTRSEARSNGKRFIA